MKIIADTATLYSPAEGAQLGLTVIPVGVAIDNNAYRDYEEITSAELLRRIAAGGVPSSSQPSVGDVLDIFEKYEEELLFLTVGDGLSGAYQTAMGARSCAAHSERIHVVDSKTLAGPLRYLAQKALMLAEQGMDAAAA
ncbi:MAG: DegV family protein, partial [Butyricicoccus sp.]|nr:DegV family protein [Butyricicoccus sp.]